MFSEITTGLAHTLIATTLIVTSTIVVANPTTTGNVFSYNAPLFSCGKGLVLYNKILTNKSITLEQRQELIKTLMGDMPKNCTILRETEKKYCEL